MQQENSLDKSVDAAFNDFRPPLVRSFLQPLCCIAILQAVSFQSYYYRGVYPYLPLATNAPRTILGEVL